MRAFEPKSRLRSSKMKAVNYFKLQAKNLHQDINSQFFDENSSAFDYHARFFELNSLVVDYSLDESDPKFKTLGKAQWIISIILGLHSWGELIHSDETTLELYKLMFEHQNEIPPYEWDDIFDLIDSDGNPIPDALPTTTDKIEFFKIQLKILDEPWAVQTNGAGYLKEIEGPGVN